MKQVWESEFTETGNLDEGVFEDLDGGTLLDTLNQLERNLEKWRTDHAEESMSLLFFCNVCCNKKLSV